MKRIGYPPHFAGAVEAASSTGGQITPPIMGAAAFLMVEFLEIQYTTIILAAATQRSCTTSPCSAMVHFEAKTPWHQGPFTEMKSQIFEVLKRGGQRCAAWSSWSTCCLPDYTHIWPRSGALPAAIAYWLAKNGGGAAVLVALISSSGQLNLTP